MEIPRSRFYQDLPLLSQCYLSELAVLFAGLVCLRACHPIRATAEGSDGSITITITQRASGRRIFRKSY
jgi:hypothetical protein